MQNAPVLLNALGLRINKCLYSTALVLYYSVVLYVQCKYLRVATIFEIDFTHLCVSLLPGFG